LLPVAALVPSCSVGASLRSPGTLNTSFVFNDALNREQR
jgi:hypothetical protein